MFSSYILIYEVIGIQPNDIYNIVMGPLPTYSSTLPNSILIDSQVLSRRLDSLPIFD